MRSKISKSGPASFAVQQVVSTAGVLVLGFVLTLLLALLTAAVTPNHPRGNFVDHMVDQFVFIGFNPPYYFTPILVALILGGISRHFFSTRSAAWVWILPLGILLWNTFTWETGGYGTYWQGVWNNYFGSDCGSSECLYELFVTVPFYTSVAYSFGWLVLGIVAAKRQR